ncbi:cytochrome C oxidase subunit IV family protein [Rhizobium leguminosarum]|uniref:cytochrome C oxidase subunit IV family protein n=1 Tax=Rhizobium leguminosarum TaxID=384 RepID=UPI0014410A31|nr:cytochrome C oxidase subunit IV family protein [Rhizobium leguminosarum]MBY5838544.1 hypothetical protein [Rhizobium leguminosarum]NKL02962.1 hypothetical protein [Rhizobium leguminosarum bv. viciae]NKM76676.1 hypothetical protein [Rhizobium leguminosarum bv. viciae]QSZ07565.1 cytochrome C oxidase subunit IV family protein [Rhizobium leguminosarum]
MKTFYGSAKAATCALMVLLGLTACTFAFSLALSEHAEAGLAAAAVSIAAFKVRLVTLDFLGLRGRRSMLVPAISGWALVLLLVALAQRVASP